MPETDRDGLAVFVRRFSCSVCEGCSGVEEDSLCEDCSGAEEASLCEGCSGAEDDSLCEGCSGAEEDSLCEDDCSGVEEASLCEGRSSEEDSETLLSSMLDWLELSGRLECDSDWLLWLLWPDCEAAGMLPCGAATLSYTLFLS